MATIQERKSKNGKTSHKVTVRLKGHPTRTATFKRLTDARHWAQQTEANIRQGRYFQTSETRKHTVTQLIDRYLRDYIPQKLDGRNQTRQLMWWRSAIGSYLISDVTPSMIAEQRDNLSATGKAPATVKRYMAPMSHAFNIAIREYGWAIDNPFSKVTKPKEPRGRVRFLSEDERDRLLEECQNSRQKNLYLIVILALSTGARQTELWSLKWDKVSFERQTIVLHKTKNDERRILPLKGQAFEHLQELYKLRDHDLPLIFPSQRDPNRPLDFRRAFEKALDRAGIEDFRWHDLRHTAASYLAMSGASPTVIAEILGHKTLEMVKRYAHLSDSHVAGQVEEMNRKFLNSKPSKSSDL